MIASSRIDQAQSEVLFAEGLTQWARGEDGPHAVAASRIVAESFILWRKIIDSKIER